MTSKLFRSFLAQQRVAYFSMEIALSTKWIKVMKGATSRNASLFHSRRMMRRYAAGAYFG